MKKVILSAYACVPFAGSELGNGWNWAYGLYLKGFKVYCLTSVRGKDKIDEFMASNPECTIEFIYVTVPDRIQNLYYTRLVGPYIHYMWWQSNALKAARKLIKNIEVDLVHHVTWGSLQMGSALWKLGLPMIFGPVGGGQFAPEAFKGYFKQYWRDEIIRKIISNLFIALNPNCKNAVRRSSVVLVTNNETLELAKTFGQQNVHRVLDASLPNSFYPSEVPAKSPSSTIRFLWVGRLMARKGLPLVIEALDKVSDSLDFSLTIAGDGDMGSFVNTWIKESKFSSKIKWLGSVPYENIKELYKTHDVFIFCSLRDSCPAQLLEAMAYGLPIITLNLHGSGIMVPDNAGYKIDVTNPDETKSKIAEAMEDISINKEMRLKMGVNAYQYALTQSWDNKIGTVIDKYYNNVK